jgi:hypothetical protein
MRPSPAPAAALSARLAGHARTSIRAAVAASLLAGSLAFAAFDGVRLAGHGDSVNPAVRRFTGMVVGLGSPDAKGRLYSFKVQPIGPRSVAPAPDELRGWRLTILEGKRFASVFSVHGNTASEIAVDPAGDSLDGLALHEVFVVEEIGPDAPASPSSADGAANGTAGGGVGRRRAAAG